MEKQNLDILSWYQKEAKRTCPDLGTESANLAHMVLGICSEYSEYLLAKSNGDTVNIYEELADKFWYIANYCTFRNYSLEELYKEANNEWLTSSINIDKYSTENYFYCVAEIQDLVKKNLAYNKTISVDDEREKLVTLLMGIQYLWKDLHFDLEKHLQNNINKLRIRFPDKFNQDNAINRNLEAERKELEK